MVQTKLTTTSKIRLADVLYIGEAGPENNNESVRRSPKKERVKIYTSLPIRDPKFRITTPEQIGQDVRACQVDASFNRQCNLILVTLFGLTEYGQAFTSFLCYIFAVLKRT